MDRRIHAVIVVMEGNLQHDLSVTHLAFKVNLSASRLSHLFKTETGLAPRGYLERLRIGKAKELLRTTSLTVKEIRNKVSGVDQRNFVRRFKKETGLTPSNFRRREPGELLLNETDPMR
jgi:transcriptional regulator GlxA family with amidase domain